MVRLCRKAAVFFLCVSVIISLWIFLQLGFLRLWLDDAVEQSSRDCNQIQFENQQHLKNCKLQVARLKKLLASISRENVDFSYFDDDFSNQPTVYAVTPTYLRPSQKAELTRLSQTLLLIPKFHWIVVEDAKEKSEKVAKLLARSGISYTHLSVATPSKYKLSSSDPSWLRPRGVLQRNVGISWFRENFTPSVANGVVYFADDDNTYDLKLFEEMRNTQKVSVWPVGLVGGLMVERPVVDNGKVVRWITSWKPNRPFPVDMAGFAVNLQLLLSHPTAAFNLSAPRGYQETSLLQTLVTLNEVEPKADNCTKVLVWHTRTEKVNLKAEVTLRQRGQQSNQGMEV